MDNNNPAAKLNHENFMEQLCHAVDVTTSKVGNDYFKARVATLSKALHAEYVFVGEVMNDYEQVGTLAFWAEDHLTDNVNTPCMLSLEQKINKTPCLLIR